MNGWPILLLGLVGCGSGSNSGMQVDVVITVPPAPPNCTASISWTPPTAREADENGVEAPFSVEEIGRYDLFIGLESGVYYREIGIEDKNLTQWQEADVLGGDNYFTMTVTDVDGLESDKAAEIIKLVDTRC